MKKPFLFLFRKGTLYVHCNILLAFLCFHVNLNSQSRAEIEQKRIEIIRKIDDTNKLIQETSQSRNAVLSDLQLIKQQVTNRKSLVSQFQEEIDLIDKNVKLKNGEVENSRMRLDSLQQQYNAILRAIYRDKTMSNPILKLLSSEAVSRSILRENYYGRLRSYVAGKLKNIEEEKTKLEGEIQALNEEKQKKISNQEEIRDQSDLLEIELKTQERLVADLRDDEQNLRQTLDIQKREREQMNIAIENIITSKFGETYESEESGNVAIFPFRKGNLDWPVTGGVISSSYGVQRHPTIPGLNISNNGIDIRAPKKAKVRVVAPGKVVGVTELKGYGKMVIVDHNQFYTVYSKLSEVGVLKDEIIQEGAEIGNLSEKNGVSELHFEIWNNNQTLDPEMWLKQ